MLREIRTPEDLKALVSEFGFLPFFSAEIAGFSIDDLTPLEVWDEYLGLGPITAPELRRRAMIDPKRASAFEASLTRLQMTTYVVPVDFIFPRDAFGEKKYSYGTTVYDLPERWLGEEACTSQYRAEPRESFEHMAAHLAKKLPNADRKDIEKLLR